MRRNVVMCVVVAISVPVFAAAQTTLPVSVDQRVRLWTAASEAITGRVISVHADGVEVSSESGPPLQVARPAVQRIEVSRGVTTKGAGAMKGAIISGAVGAVLAGLQHEEIGESGSSVGHAAALGAWSGGLFGGLIGAGVGAARAGEHWQQVWP